MAFLFRQCLLSSRAAPDVCFSLTRSGGIMATAGLGVRAARPVLQDTGALFRRGLTSSAKPRAVASAQPHATEAPADTAARPSPLSLANNPSGKVVIYRGPCFRKPAFDYTAGFIFIGCGLTLSLMIHDHLMWPLFSRDPDNPPELVALPIRQLVAGAAALIGILTSYLFFVSPTKSIVRLTLDLHKRELIMRTAAREFSSFLPRFLYPKPLRRVAERKGWYRTSNLRERVVPLSSVYRVRGSALQSSYTAKHQIRSVTPVKGRGSANEIDPNLLVSPLRSSIEIRPGNQRMWYTLESSGGAMRNTARKPGFAGFQSWYTELLRDKTDWSVDEDIAAAQHGSNAPMAPMTREQEARNVLGPKQPWFADRRTFDDIIPRITRKQ